MKQNRYTQILFDTAVNYGDSLRLIGVGGIGFSMFEKQDAETAFLYGALSLAIGILIKVVGNAFQR